MQQEVAAVVLAITPQNHSLDFEFWIRPKSKTDRQTANTHINFGTVAARLSLVWLYRSIDRSLAIVGNWC